MLNKDLVLAVAKSKLEENNTEITDKEILKEISKLSGDMDFLKAVELVYSKLSAGINEKNVYKSFVPDFSRKW